MIAAGVATTLFYMAWAGGSGMVSTNPPAMEEALECRIPVQHGVDFQVEFYSYLSSTPGSNLSGKYLGRRENANRVQLSFEGAAGKPQVFEFFKNRLHEAATSGKSIAVKARFFTRESDESRVKAVGHCTPLRSSQRKVVGADDVFAAQNEVIQSLKTHRRDLSEIEEVRVASVDSRGGSVENIRFDVDFVREPRGSAGRAYYCTQGFQYDVKSKQVRELREDCQI